MKDITISEVYIKSEIDKIIEEIEKEYSSRHELHIKVSNYDWLKGRLYELYDICGAREEIMAYRKDDIHKLQVKFNNSYVQPFTRRNRRAEAKMNAFANYGAKEVWL